MIQLQRLFFLFGFVLSSYLVEAAQFYATVDKTQASLRDYLTLTLTVEGGDPHGEPRVPKISGVLIQSQGRSSQTQWINGKVSSKIEWSYLLTPSTVGTLTIPGIPLKVDEREYITTPISVEIVAATVVPEEESPIRVSSRLSSFQAYVGQTITYTFEVWIREGVQATNLQMERPDLKGFQTQELGEAQRERVIKNGVSYEVLRLQLGLMSPQSGRIEINPAALRGTQLVQGTSRSRDPFGFSGFNTRSIPLNLSSNPLTLEVLAVPETGKPPHFSGLIGSYALEASLSKNQVAAGDSISLKMIISGKGRAESATVPLLMIDPSFKRYDDQPIYENTVHEGQLIGTSTFTIALVPSVPGHYKIPPVELNFFDPDLRQYRVQTVTLPEIEVLSGEKSIGDPSQPPPINPPSNEKAPNPILPFFLSVISLVSLLPWLKIGGVIGLLIFGGIGGFFFKKWWAKDQLKNSERRTQGKAFHSFRKQLKAVEKQSISQKEQAIHVMSLLKNYIGLQASLRGEALTEQELRNWIEGRIPEELTQDFDALLSRCEWIQYASEDMNPEEKSLLKWSERLVEQINPYLVPKNKSSKK